jgi:hypothetical protein
VSFQPVPGLKGILSKGEKTPQQKHVVFDRIVLFHDMAYEGQYDELLELASEVKY